MRDRTGFWNKGPAVYRLVEAAWPTEQVAGMGPGLSRDVVDLNIDASQRDSVAKMPHVC